MLKFTSSEPMFMGQCGEKFVPKTEECKTHFDKRYPSFVTIYIDGIAQDKAGYDIPQIIGGTLSNVPGEYPCELHLPDEVLQCLLIVWEGVRPTRIRGHIVLNTDSDSIERARRDPRPNN